MIVVEFSELGLSDEHRKVLLNDSFGVFERDFNRDTFKLEGRSHKSSDANEVEASLYAWLVSEKLWTSHETENLKKSYAQELISFGTRIARKKLTDFVVQPCQRTAELKKEAGEIYFKSEFSGLEIKCSSNGSEPISYMLKGTIAYVFKLTEAGFELCSLSVSNHTLKSFLTGKMKIETVDDIKQMVRFSALEEQDAGKNSFKALALVISENKAVFSGAELQEIATYLQDTKHTFPEMMQYMSDRATKGRKKASLYSGGRTPETAQAYKCIRDFLNAESQEISMEGLVANINAISPSTSTLQPRSCTIC